MIFPKYILALVVATIGGAIGEDANNGGYYSPSSLKPGSCFTLKIAEDNDDDGNSYFYNGAYRAQHQRYAAAIVCDSEGVCDSSKEYVLDLDTYLEYMTNYVKNYCYACANNCQRRLEDEEDNENANANVAVDCETCADACASYSANANQGVDETEYLECQYAMADNDISYYSAPQCGSNGDVVIGLFYDDECSIRSGSSYDRDFSYSTFSAIQEMSLDCTTGACDELFQNAIYCEDGSANDNDNNKLCSRAMNASRQHIYYKKPWYRKANFIMAVSLVVLFGAAFLFLSYTYYFRHSQVQLPLADLDGKDLPDIS